MDPEGQIDMMIGDSIVKLRGHQNPSRFTSFGGTLCWSSQDLLYVGVLSKQLRKKFSAF